LFWRSEHECVDREGFIRELGSLVMEARGQQLTLERWVICVIHVKAKLCLRVEIRNDLFH
jgi:hypothetical protein